MLSMVQGAAFAWLGTFYLEVAGDEVRAQRCFQRALALDPQQATAGILTFTPPFDPLSPKYTFMA